MAIAYSGRGRLAIWAVLLLLGTGFAVQTLRMRMGEAAVERRVGEAAASVRPQNGWGLALLAHAQFERGDVQAARDTSLKALRQTPLAVGALRTLARSLDKLQGGGAGEGAWQVAATMGWRDKQTQLWALLRALSNGQAEIFAMRADALLRAGDRDGLMAAMIRQFVAEPAIRGPFVDRLATNPMWRFQFFWTEKPLSPKETEGLRATLLDLGRTESPPTRRETWATIDSLVRLRRYREAVELDRAVVPDRGAAGRLIDDPGFDRSITDYERDSTPFDWRILQVGYASAALDESEGRSMTIIARGQHAQNPIRRLVAVSPGAYRLRFAMRGPRESPAAVGIAVQCAPATASIAQSPGNPLPAESWQTREIRFLVGEDCPILEIGLGSTGKGAGEAQFDNVLLERATER